jgi:hypothetical protein
MADWAAGPFDIRERVSFGANEAMKMEMMKSKM